MTQDHKLLSTPVSVSDGFKRADGRTWSVLLVAAAIAGVIVLLINLFVEKPNIRWPSSPKAAPAPAAAPAEQEQPAEPKTFDVAPRGSVPAPGKK